MSDNMCEHGGLDGNCLRCKDATITALREEAAEVKKRYQLSVYAEETERKARVDMTSDNAALRARCEAAEGKVEKAREAMKSSSSTYSVFDKLRQILE